MNAPDTITLDERLCLALYAASRAMTSRYRPLLSGLGLTYPQYLVMVVLWEQGDASVGQVGARLDLESSTLSPLLKRLEGMGLVTRTRATDDERSVVVGLTEAGHTLEAGAAHVPQGICDATALSTHKQLALVAQLRTLAAELKASLAE